MKFFKSLACFACSLLLLACGGEDTAEMTAPGGFGAPCTAASDCMSNLCLPSSNRCTSMCQTSADCALGANCEGGICILAAGGAGGTGGAGAGAAGGTGGNGGGAGAGAGGTGGMQGGQVDIPDVKTGLYPDDTTVSVEGVVTALRVNAEGLYSHMVLQVPTDSPNYRGVENSGLWVYLNNADNEAWRMNPPMPGTVVRLTGRTNNFYDQWQVQHVEALDVIGQANIPAAVEVSPADIATGGPRAMSLEGSLVQVRNVNVTEVEPEAGPGDGQDNMPTYEFVVDGQLRVDDYFYRIAPFPTVGTSYSSITGVLRWGNANSKIEPRSAGDIQ